MLECWSVEVYSVGVLRCTVWEFCGVAVCRMLEC